MKKFAVKAMIISTIIIGSMIFNSIGVLAICEELKGGTILHAWSWSFKTIKDNIQEIEEAGYDAIQVSPPQECKVNKECCKCKQEGKIGCTCFSENWYYLYQPTNFKIGNYSLGTKEEFEEMCAVAKQHNIKIIVDVVLNHVSIDLNSVSDDIKKFPNIFHNQGELSGTNAADWCDRWKVTQRDMLGLYDLNTGDIGVQKMIKDYMNDCLKCGAWGFRYDAAKHIELPKEVDGNFGSDFWPNITKNAAENGAKYQYGEVLQDSVSRFYEYAKYMDVTASKYGQKIRNAIHDRRIGHNYIMDYNSEGVSVDKLVTWVESHDNYTDLQSNEYVASAWMSDDEIRVGWAIVASRIGGVPLFFSRPVDGGGRNRLVFPEKTKLGNKGSDLFKDPYIVAINKFRKAMKDEDEYLRSQNDKLLIIERGNKGMVIINWSGNSAVNSETRLSDGIYADAVSNKEFKVENGRISGNTGNEITILTKK